MPVYIVREDLQHVTRDMASQSYAPSAPLSPLVVVKQSLGVHGTGHTRGHVPTAPPQAGVTGDLQIMSTTQRLTTPSSPPKHANSPPYPLCSNPDPHPIVYGASPYPPEVSIDGDRVSVHVQPGLTGQDTEHHAEGACKVVSMQRADPVLDPEPENSADTAQVDQRPDGQTASLGDVNFLGGTGSLRNRKAATDPQNYAPPMTAIAESDKEEAQPSKQTPDDSNHNSYSATYSSGVSSSNTTAPSKNPDGDKLTVLDEWKVDKELKKGTEEENGGGTAVALVKWVVTCLMMLALLVCLISTKMAVLVLSKQLNSSYKAVEEGQDLQETWRRYSEQFLVLYFLLSISPFVNTVRAAWYGLLDKTVPWPSRRAILLSVFRAFLETLGLCVLVYGVLGRYDSNLSLLLMATPLLLPAIDSTRHVRVAERWLGVIMAFGGVAATVVLILTAKPGVEVWHVLLAFLALSAAWLPSIQRYITVAAAKKTKKESKPFLNYGTFGPNDENNIASTTTTTTATTTTGPNPSPGNTLSLAMEETGGAEVLRPPATWKTTFIVHSCRLVFTFVVSALLFILDSPGGPSKVLTGTVHSAFLSVWSFSDDTGPSTWTALGVGPTTALLAYVLAFGACHMNMMRGALTPPLVLATPLSVLAVSVPTVCEGLLGVGDSVCTWEQNGTKWSLVAAAAVCFLLAHLLTFRYSLWRSSPVLLQQESVIFWLPGYNCPSLDTWLLLNRRRDVTGEKDEKKKKKKSKVFVCTTMYREEEDEMRQLLESLNEINKAQAAGQRCFESHIIFDGGVRGRELSEFSLTLIGLLQDTLGIQPEACTKTVTPYGLKLSWNLPGPKSHLMTFCIHLKDNQMVKNKKRWSQVMYMSYVLDFLTLEPDEDNFILTTDADVIFTPDSVEALLDLMSRDQSIGAVCARTHPIGDGPLVWYQKFEYAIGHWFQKTAEHVLGSVLCAPGCFSVFRCRALADVLPKYARRVETAFDFLTKDMGEDRWLCTLMLQCGWRIEYCATSENRTNCPNHFDEFYKQRRRWIASTLANLMLIVKEWKYVRKLNQRMSSVFLLYQVLLLVSTLIGPSTIVLIVSGGLTYAWQFDAVAAVILQIMLCTLFALVCVYTTQPTQLMVAKIYTFVYAVVMTAVAVGTAAQIVEDLNSSDRTEPAPTVGPNDTQPSTTTKAPTADISEDLPVSVTTLYFGALAGIFILAGMLHPREFLCLIHALWYLLCLPSGYLVLTIYSVSNITDSSWGLREERVPNPAIVDSFLAALHRLVLHTQSFLLGTREKGEEKSAVKKQPWQQRLRAILEDLCFCCVKQPTPREKSDAEVQTTVAASRSTSIAVPSDDNAPSSPGASGDIRVPLEDENQTAISEADLEIPGKEEPIPVEDWLPQEMRAQYATLFRRHGFDDTVFIAGMTETEMKRMGIKSKGHLHYLLAQVALLPRFEIEYKVPTIVDEWLDEIGLPMYKDNFRRNHIRTPKEMAILKGFQRKEIVNELRITKDGHIKRLLYAIRMLRDPTEAQRKLILMKEIIDNSPTHHLEQSNKEEYDFWQKLREVCLQPDLEAFGLESEIKVKLVDLRNNWLLILAVSNTLWLILITTLASRTDLTVAEANPVGLLFLVVFGLLFVIQFLSMLQHRLATFSHFLARAPYRFGKPMDTAWSFNEQRDPEDIIAEQQYKQSEQQARERLKNKNRKGYGRSRGQRSTETAPLMPQVEEEQTV